MKIETFKDLIVWQKSIDLVDAIYIITKYLPKAEVYGLSSQMQRAAVSIPSNIAEGYKRNHKAEFIHFLGIANASSAELETQLIICQRQYIDVSYQESLGLLLEVQKMLHVMIKKLKG